MRELLVLALSASLVACSDEPENIQAKAENISRHLEQEANEIEAETANGIANAVVPLDSEAEMLLNQIANATGIGDNASGNAAR